MIYLCKFDYGNAKHGQRKIEETQNGRRLLRYALTKEYGIDSDTLTIEKGEHGKPFFKDRKDIFFNISHSGDYVAVVLGDCPLGVDVQVIREVKPRLIDKLCNEREKDFVLSSGNPDNAFITLWALKESYIKAIGKGMSFPMDKINFDIKGFKGDSFSGAFSNQDGLFCVWKNNDYVLAACSLGEFEFDLQYVSL